MKQPLIGLESSCPKFAPSDISGHPMGDARKTGLMGLSSKYDEVTSLKKSLKRINQTSNATSNDDIMQNSRETNKCCSDYLVYIGHLCLLNISLEVQKFGPFSLNVFRFHNSAKETLIHEHDVLWKEKAR